jgi:hypothetical protein
VTAAPGRLRVPFLDLAGLHDELRTELDAAALRVLHSDRVLMGPELEGFEQSWAAAVGARFAIGVGSGLDALSLGLRALGVGEGDEVLVPSHTFVATWLAVVHVGAVPVPVDVLSAAGAWDASALEAAVTPRTRAVIPVHLYGHPVDLDAVLGAGPRRTDRRPTAGRSHARDGLELLPGQEPGRLRRRRCGQHVGPPHRAAAAVAAQLRVHREVPARRDRVEQPPRRGAGGPAGGQAAPAGRAQRPP